MNEQQSQLCCRACLTTDCRLYDIHEYKVDEIFSRITDTPASQDKLPQHVCAWCLTLLRKCASFRAMCVRTQQQLTKILVLRMDINGVQRCQSPQRSFYLTRTEVQIVDYVPSENIYQPEGVRIVKTEPETEYEIELHNEIEDSFHFKNKKRHKYVTGIRRTETAVHENMVLKLDNDNDKIDVGSTVLKIEFDEIENYIESSDSLVLEDNKDVLSKNKSLSCVDNYVHPEKRKKGTEETKQTTKRKIVDCKDESKSDDINYEQVLKNKVCVKKVKREKPRKKVKIKDLRHPTDGYILFDFAAFESAYGVKVVVLSKEEQLEEIACRKKSRNFLESPFKCEECGKGFLAEKPYTNHRTQQHNPNKKHRCDICGMRFRSNCLRQRHEDEHRLKFPCIECDFVSRNRYKAKGHHAMHEGKTFECQHCGVSFTKSSTYLSHLRLVHPENNVVCVECGETFVSDKGLRNHMKKTHPESLKSQQFKCSTCSAKFTSVEALNRHTDTARDHADLRPCEQCGENCASEAELHQHVREKHPTESHHCEVCDTTFSNAAAYDTHHRRKHLGERYYYRPGAARDFKRRPRYNLPTYSKSCVCDQCGYKAKSTSMMVYHMRSHLAVKPFPCPHCPKTCVTNASLTWHMRTHTGEKRFQCADCSLAFSAKGNLVRHQRVVHMKQCDKFSCEMCERWYTTKAMLKLHIKTVHEGMPWPKRARRGPSGHAVAQAGTEGQGEIINEVF